MACVADAYQIHNTHTQIIQFKIILKKKHIKAKKQRQLIESRKQQIRLFLVNTKLRTYGPVRHLNKKTKIQLQQHENRKKYSDELYNKQNLIQ